MSFRIETAEEAAARALDPFAEQVHPAPTKYRWHCSRCGRFVRSATVRRLAPIPGEADDRDYQGECPEHGRVDVVWPEV